MTQDPWVREPRQARSQATLERFLDATNDLLETRRFEDITVADIVGRAERTVGSFYARFDDKHAVLHVLVDRLQQRIIDNVHAFCDPVRWEGRSAAEFVTESVRLNVAAYRRSNALFRAALTAAATDERFRSARAATLAECAAEQKRFLLSRAGELHCDDPERASDQLFELVASTLDHELLFGRFTPTSPVSDVEMQRELVARGLDLLGLRPSVVDLDRLPAPPAPPASTELHLAGHPVAGDHEDRSRATQLDPSGVPDDGLDGGAPPDRADVHAHAGRD